MIGSINSSRAGNGNFLSNKISETSALVWSKTIGGSYRDLGYDMVELPDTSLIFIKSTCHNYQGNDYNILVAKTNASGDEIWVKTVGGDQAMRWLIR